MMRSVLELSFAFRLAWLCVSVWLLAAGDCAAQLRLPAGRGVIELEARQQRMEGKLYFAEGDVEIRYENLRLLADRVELDTESGEASAAGRIRFELDGQVLEAGEARYNIRTGRGRFLRVHGSIRVRRAPNPLVLVSDNPFSFVADEVERTGDFSYEIRNAWVTVCEPDRPIWSFHAPRATIRMERSARLEHASFRLLRIPVLYLPYATVPMGRRLRQSGFLLPHFANTSRKGFVAGDSFYWAMTDWADFTVGAEYLSRRGFSHMAELRARPWDNVTASASYFAVNDRGLPGPGGARVPQGGHETSVRLDGYFPGGWRGVADLNTLSSLTFRLAFAETFADAVKSEIRSTAFVNNNSRGLSFGFSAQNYKNFLTAAPDTAVVLRSAPGFRLSSVEQAPWKDWPVYFGFHASAEAVHRSDPTLNTGTAVQRSEISPHVTIPLRAGPWLGVTPTAAVRATRYGASQDATATGTLISGPVTRTTAELEVDIRPPALARIWESSAARWKHALEPKITYRFTDGVNRFGRFLRFDENDTLTDSNEVEYSLTQRLFRREGDSGAEEFLSWRVGQKYYFDPTFGGALEPGRRNVFQALNSITAFAFADGRRRFSPLVSDLRVTPGGRYDAQFRLDFDPDRGGVSALGTLLKVKPFGESFVTLGHFATRATSVLQPRANQVRALVGWGEMARRGWNASFGFSYDVRESFLQNQVVQVSYNGACCGIGFEYRRLALGPVRSENQFRVALLIANLGTFGNLRRQEKIF